MKAIEFNSCLADQFRRFIELRRLAGTDYRSQIRLLGYFDLFLVKEQFMMPLTRQVIEKYQQSMAHLNPRSQNNRFCVVRQLCKYIAQSAPHTYIPESMKSISSQRAYHSYIFTPKEVEALLAAALRLPLPEPLPHTYYALFGLLYCTGIRIGEALCLMLKDFIPEENLLYIAEGKFRKARWIVLSSSASQALERYLRQRCKIGPTSSDSSLFINSHTSNLKYAGVCPIFHRLREQCGIPYDALSGPHIHSLRHSFAVNRLLAWYRDGKDINARLPALATYMGHVNVSSTQVYLQPTAELLQQANALFHDYYVGRVSPHGGQL